MPTKGAFCSSIVEGVEAKFYPDFAHIAREDIKTLHVHNAQGVESAEKLKGHLSALIVQTQWIALTAQVVLNVQIVLIVQTVQTV